MIRTLSNTVVMEIDSATYTEKGIAGAALPEEFGKITTIDPVKIGSYRGFEMSLSFDSYNKNYKIALHGKMSYSTALGSDTFGKFPS